MTAGAVAVLLVSLTGAGPTTFWCQQLGSYADKPTVADLNGDGRYEVVVATQNGDVRALAGLSGKELWKYQAPTDGFVTCPIVTDTDKDWRPEIIVTGSTFGAIVCINGEDGTLQWKETASGTGIVGSAAVGDLNGDGKQVLVFGQNKTVRALDAATGEVVADADGDGKLEIYYAANSIARCDLMGKTTWEWAPPSEKGIASPLVLADVNGDRKLELVVGSYDGSVYCISPSKKQLWRCPVVPTDRDGRAAFVPSSSPVVLDADGDGAMDVVSVSPASNDPKVYALDGRSGKPLWKAAIQGFSICCPVAADIDGDARPEVIFSDAGGSLYAIKVACKGGAAWAKYHGDVANHADAALALSQAGDLIAGRPTVMVRQQPVLWEAFLSEPAEPCTCIQAGPPVVDVDHQLPPPRPPRPPTPIAVMLNGKWLPLSPAPVQRNNAVLVPLRGVFEAMGAIVTYDKATHGITATGKDAKGRDVELKLVVGEAAASKNGNPVALKAPPVFIGESVYVPLRFIAEAFGAEVKWDEARKNVEIKL
ncbi:MAG: PQQ-binding-like beta-propeller repeat protein [Armatimonadetes bacterium]|nr:PQQ-binding-like beta-propeller repeat protein [Armatimonadota bacterium]